MGRNDRGGVRASELRGRADVPDVDIPQIIEVAARLQDADIDAAARPTVAELEEVAEELDIDARYVEEAIGVIREERRVASEAAEAAGADRRRWAGMVGLVAGGLGVVSLLVLFSGVTTLRGLESDRVAAEEALVVVIERQAGLAPQLAALAGAEVDLTSEVAAVRSGDLDERLAAVEALNTKMAAALAALPADAGDATRLDLHHELTGGWNRITTERRRLAEVEARVRSASSRPDVALAVGLGLGP